MKNTDQKIFRVKYKLGSLKKLHICDMALPCKFDEHFLEMIPDDNNFCMDLAIKNIRSITFPEAVVQIKMIMWKF